MLNGKICPKQGNNFDELPCVIPKLTFAFLLFLSSFISFESVGTKEITMLYSLLEVFSQRKCITKCAKVAICIISF